MSNIYLLEPHTNGKVILHTSYGDISIELWSKETPKTCRNFIQLCMEGYYNDTIFHRIVSGFIIQGGDPEGTGLGGESSFEGGKPFADEFHSRLRFVRRGLVAMANSGTPNDNKSQFFITLDATMELQNKHTIFGKVAGDTIFNVLKIGGLEVDSNERPLYPPKVNSCTIVVNPFDDIVPRISRQEQEAARLRELEAQKKPEKQKKLKKNVALLSFADDAPDLTMDENQDQEQEDNRKRKKKMLSSHDLLEDDPTLSREVDTSLAAAASEEPQQQQQEGSSSKKRRENADDDGESVNAFDQRMRDQIRERFRKSKLTKESAYNNNNTNTPASVLSATDMAADSATSSAEPTTPQPTEAERRKQEIQKLENDIRKMHGRGDDDEVSTKTKSKAGKVSLLQLEREQYKTRGELKGKTRSKSSKGMDIDMEQDLLKQLSSFESKVFASAQEPELNPAPKKNDAPPCEIHGIPSCESCQDTIAKKQKRIRDHGSDDGQALNRSTGDAEEGERVDSDDDDTVGWMQHKLVFEKDLKGKEVSLSAKRDDINEYIVIDPLNKAASTTAALAMEQQKKTDKIKREKHFSSRDRSNSSRDNKPHTSSSSGSGGVNSRHDSRPYDKDRDRPSSSSYSRDNSRRSEPGYDRDGRNGGRDSRSSRDSRDNRDRDRRW
ncbi:Peptidyl-prolyl isomerase cwc27 [Mortierella claussenii]|nr:Peptidyl-prolyl isomerase cwc27 [Mortierella claussenii]